MLNTLSFATQTSRKLVPGIVYFWSNMVNTRKHLLQSDDSKKAIIEVLQQLSRQNKVEVFSFVIMPTHVHLLWSFNTYGNEEMPNEAFTQMTSKALLKSIIKDNPEALKDYAVDSNDQRIKIWQDEPLALEIYSLTMMEQKVKFIHDNPSNGKWKLSRYPEGYKWSSARYQMEGVDEFGILSDYDDKFY